MVICVFASNLVFHDANVINNFGSRHFVEQGHLFFTGSLPLHQPDNESRTNGKKNRG